MLKEKIAFIINPVSGRKQRSDQAEIIRKSLDNTKYKALIYHTEYKGHAYELAEKAAKKGCKTVVAVGGDGTVNEVGGAAIQWNMTMGIIPAGSGNGLARHLKIPVHAAKAIKLINKGEKMLIDAGKLDDKWFFCTCGIGFDARIGRKFSKTSVRGDTTHGNIKSL